MPFEIAQWTDIKGRYRGTILLGNGASMAISPSFSYRSLIQHARDRQLLPADAQRLFNSFGADDFELILRILWQATNVNQALQIADWGRTRAAYISVRDCLIQTVRDIHPIHAQVSGQLPTVYEFLRSFDTVISLNYDLLVYWTMTYGLGVNDGHAFKDCFVNGRFDDNWARFRAPIGMERTTTLVFYPHGNLSLGRNLVEQEFKIRGEGAGLLEQILQLWFAEGVVPLFVSEGTWQQKISAMQGSYYLSTVFREVIRAPRESLVIYGWSFGQHDVHLLQRMVGAGIRRVAVSVFRDDQGLCNVAFQTIREALGHHVDIEFFNSESPGCWNNPHAPFRGR